MDITEFLDICEALLLRIDDLPDRCQAKDRWEELVRDIQDWSEERQHVTQRQRDAIDKISAAVGKWER